MKNKHKAVVTFYKVAAALLVSLGFSFSSRKCKLLYKQATQEVYDALIVPGVPFKGQRWDLIMKARVIWATILYKQGRVRHIIFSGGAVHSPYYESEIMCTYAVALGVPQEHVISEKLAEHSTENVYYSYRLAHKLGLLKVALASDPFQTKLLRKFTFKRVDANIMLLPVVYDMVNEVDIQLTEPTIDFECLRVKDFVPLKERENLRKRLRGTSGSRIDWDVYQI